MGTAASLRSAVNNSDLRGAENLSDLFLLPFTSNTGQQCTEGCSVSEGHSVLAMISEKYNVAHSRSHVSEHFSTITLFLCHLQRFMHSAATEGMAW